MNHCHFCGNNIPDEFDDCRGAGYACDGPKTKEESIHNTREDFAKLAHSVKYRIEQQKTPNEEGANKALQILIDTHHQELQKAREEALAREKQLKQVHMMELDAISCKSIEDFVIWRDHRKQRPNQSELDQPIS